MASRPPIPLPPISRAARAGLDVFNAHRSARGALQAPPEPAPAARNVRKDFADKLGLPENATEQQILNAVSDVVASNKQAREARASQAVAESKEAAEDALYESFFGSSSQEQPLSASDQALYAAAFGGDRA